MFLLPDWIYDILIPRPKMRCREWMERNAVLHTSGSFTFDEYPHWLEICDWVDNPQYREYLLEFATRLGKGVFCYNVLCYFADVDPSPSILGAPVESKLREWVKDRLYKMADRCPALRDKVYPARRRSGHRVDFTDCVIKGAWAGSPTTLGDVDAKYGVASEIDKWTMAMSDEGDALALFGERGKNFPDRKFFYESTPTIEGSSRIDRGRLQSTNCQRYVPCPRCSHYQRLRIGSDAPEKGGIYWDHDADGHSDPDLAYKTARYICESCHGEIHDEHRSTMMRSGRWVPHGQSIDKQGRLHGSPRRNGQSAGFQLSSLHSLRLWWGDCARAFVLAKPKPKLLRNYVNGWLAEVWKISRDRIDLATVAQRLSVDYSIHTVPVGGLFLTAGVDVQKDHFKYVVAAWGLRERGWAIDWGTVDLWDDLVAQVLDRKYATCDGLAPTLLGPRLTLVDSGHTKRVYRLCQSADRRGRWVKPCKGGDRERMQDDPIRRTRLGKDERNERERKLDQKRSGLDGPYLFRINKHHFEELTDEQLYKLDPQRDGGLSFPREAKSDVDLWEQLTNAALVPKHKTKKDDPDEDEPELDKLVWRRVDRSIPDDLRSAYRYARAAAEILTRGQWDRLPSRRPLATAPPEPQKPSPRSNWITRSRIS